MFSWRYSLISPSSFAAEMTSRLIALLFSASRTSRIPKGAFILFCSALRVLILTWLLVRLIMNRHLNLTEWMCLLNRTAGCDVYLLEFHPSLAIASQLPVALNHAYWVCWFTLIAQLNVNCGKFVSFKFQLMVWLHVQFLHAKIACKNCSALQELQADQTCWKIMTAKNPAQNLK